MSFPHEGHRDRRPSAPWLSPPLEEIMYDGGRRYEGYQSRDGPISDERLDFQTKRFHEKVNESYHQNHPRRNQARYAPNASAGQIHRGHEIFYSSTERVAREVGLGISGQNSAYNRAVENSGFATRHNYSNRCAEGGTTGMIQRKYGNDVDMRGDRISTYGMIPDEEGQEPQMGFHPGCASRRAREPPTMGCEDVLDAYGIVDVHGRGGRRRRQEEEDYYW